MNGYRSYTLRRYRNASSRGLRLPVRLIAHVAYSYVMSAKSDSHEIDEVEPLPDDTASQARRVVAAYANDAEECRMFLSMLGIGPAKIEV